MSWKSILAPLSGTDRDLSALTVAAELARRFDAFADVLFVEADPAEAAPMLGEGISGMVVEQVMRSAEKEMSNRKAQAEKSFKTKLSESGLAQGDAPVEGGAMSFRTLTGREDRLVAEIGRLRDVVLVPNQAASRNDIQAAMTMESALMSSGRPVIVSPPKPGKAGRRIAIAWNGGVEAAHAVNSALPVLRLADSVVVLSAATQKTNPQVQSGLVDYLGWHGVDARNEIIEPGDRAVGEALLEAAGDHDSDMLVMGGYGHSRMREMIFGGVTRYALTNAEIAVLITH